MKYWPLLLLGLMVGPANASENNRFEIGASLMFGSFDHKQSNTDDGGLGGKVYIQYLFSEKNAIQIEKGGLASISFLGFLLPCFSDSEDENEQPQGDTCKWEMGVDYYSAQYVRHFHPGKRFTISPSLGLAKIKLTATERSSQNEQTVENQFGGAAGLKARVHGKNLGLSATVSYMQSSDLSHLNYSLGLDYQF